MRSRSTSTQDGLISDDPFYTVVGDSIQGSYFPDTAATTPSSTTTTGSVMSVNSGGITINLILDAAAQAAPASFKSGLQQAVAILAANIADKITVNINIDYSGTGGGAAAGPDNGYYESYAWTRSELVNNASVGDTTFNSLPTGTTIQGQQNVAVWNAQLKLWGVIGANDTTTDDASAYFSTDINPNLLVGVALHELTHAMGRVPYGSAPDVFDLFRFTSQNVRLFQGGATAPAAYFSLDNGATKIADYGQRSDPSDFLNSGVQGPNDPFNEYYSGSSLQSLTAADLKQLDALGFHIGSSTLTGSQVAAHTPDFNGDGNTDLLFVNNSSLGVAVWELNGTQVLANPQVGTMTSGFHYAKEGDFDGGGKTDLLMLNDTTHEAQVWLMNGTQVTSETTVGTISAAGGWHFADVGDFNDDGKSDLLLLNSASNGVAVWELNGSQVIANPQVGTTAPGFHYAASGDFNGDGKTDLLMLNDTTHDLQVWLMNGTQVASETNIGTINAPGGWRYAGMGDFNGDGKTDLLLLNDTSHGVAVWLMNGTQVTANPQIGTISASAGWRFADIGDFNGDNTSDLLLLSDNTHGVAVWELNGTQVFANPQVGTMASGDTYAGLQDVNGDHKSDILFQNTSTHALTVWEMNSTQIALNAQIGAVNAAGGWHLAT